MTKFLNISTDNTLGGSSPSDETVSSQKAIKDYVDTKDGNFVTLNTLQTLTSGKKIFANDAVMAGNQTALLATISNSSTYTTDSAWVGRYICGAKNLTFLMGTYRTMAGIGAHSWTNAQTGSGASWADFYLNPDGSNAVYIGGNLWTKNSGWMKIKNSGNASGTIEINRGTISSPTWKGVACWGDNVSKFVNDAGYTTNVGTVTSVNNTSPDSNGNVSLSIPTVNNPTITFTQGGTTKGTITLNQSGDQTIEFDAGGSGGGAVDSVNGQTGTVVLDAEDVGALPDSTVIPTDTSDLTNGAGFITSSALSGYQTTITGGATTITSSNLTASRALISNSSGKVAVSAVTSTELGYLDGVTSAIQTQLNNKQAKIGAGTANNIVAYSGTAGTLNTLTRTTSVRAKASASDTYIPTEKAVATSLEGKYDASNPAGYTSNVGTVTSVNNVSPVNGNVTLSIPSEVTESTVSGWGFTKNTGTVTSVNNVSPVNGNVTLSIPSEVTETTVSGWGFTKNAGTVTSVNNVSPVNGNVTLSIPSIDNLANKDLSNLSTTGQAIIDGKVDLDLNNMNPSQSAKETIVGWCNADRSAGVQMSITTTEHSYTCPKDGVIVFASAGYNGQYGYLKINDITILNVTSGGSAYVMAATGEYRVSKNDVVKYKTGYTASTSTGNILTFYPLKGV